MIGFKRTMLAVAVSFLLVGTALASVWLMASSGVFSAGGEGLPSASAGEISATSSTSTTGGGEAGEARLLQPRDPFRPLVVPETSTTTSPGDTTTTTAGGDTTTTTAGGDTTTTTAGGDTTTTTAGGSTTTTGATTTTTQGDQPSGTRVVLLEVRDEAGVKTAVLTVDGETYTVGVGETFADDFKVISLDDDGGVFTYRDSAFTLSVGQAILK